MPPKTRRAGHGPTAAQSRLSFNNRITKPSDTTLAKSKLKLNEPAQETITTEIAKQSTPEPDSPESQLQSKGKGATTKPSDSPVRIIPSPSRQKSKRRVRRSLNDDDEEVSFEAAEKQANKISDAQVRKYWKAEEDSRLAPRGILPHFPSLHKSIALEPVFSAIPCDTHANIQSHSPPRKTPHLRENPASLRPLLRIRSLHRHNETATMETRTGTFAQSTDRSARRLAERGCKGCESKCEEEWREEGHREDCVY